MRSPVSLRALSIPSFRPVSTPFLVAPILVLTLAGCLSSDGTGDGPEGEDAPLEASTFSPATVLAGLELATLPDAERCLSDLEDFTTMAPRRYEGEFQHGMAVDWLVREFEGAGLNTSIETFPGVQQLTGQPTVDGQNVIAVLPGTTDRTIIFGAHYDSAVTAYGAAYDDGSGTMIVVELARAMAAYRWNHTLVFAAWDQEEAGLVGSAAYAQASAEAGAEIVLNINFDMTGINWPAKLGGAVDVPMDVDFGGGNDTAFVELWRAAADHLAIPASGATTSTGATGGSSDHGSFLAAGYAAAWVHGALIGNYPGYHNADTVETMIADVGGDRAALVAGFDTVLQTVFLFTFLLDAAAMVGPAALS